MNSLEDYDLTFLGEPVHVAAKVKNGPHDGVIALTESRLVFIRKNDDKEFIDHEYPLKSKIFVGQQDGLEPFTQPLLRSAEVGAEQPQHADTVLSSPEESEIHDDTNEYDGHDIAIVGETPLLVAKASNGVIVLTETRLVYLRQEGNTTFIDREADRSDITSANYSESWDSWFLEFNEGAKLFRYLEIGDDLKPFVEPLQAGPDAHESKRSEAEEETLVEPLQTSVDINESKLNEYREETLAAPEVSGERDDSHTYSGHDIAIVGEPPLLMAKASNASRSGVLVLTETRLIHLRKEEGTTFVNRESDRSHITSVEYRKSWGTRYLEFNDGVKPVSYSEIGDDLKPFVEPLQAVPDANASKCSEAEEETLVEPLQASVDANESTRSEVGEETPVETEVSGKCNLSYIYERHDIVIEEYAGYDLSVVGEPVLLAASAAAGIRSGVVTLTPTRLVYLRKRRNKPFIDRVTAFHELSQVTFDGSTIRYNKDEQSQYYLGHDDLSPIYESLVTFLDAGENADMHQVVARVMVEKARVKAEENVQANTELETIIGEPVTHQCDARHSGDFREGKIVLTPTRVVHLRSEKGSWVVKREHPIDKISHLKLGKQGSIEGLHFRVRSGVVSYATQDLDSIRPIYEALQPIVAQNEARRKEKARKAQKRAREEVVKREAEERKRVEAEEREKVELENIIGETVTHQCDARHSDDFRGGKIALTPTRVVHLRSEKGSWVVKREHPIDKITHLELGKQGPIEGLHFRVSDGGGSVSYDPQDLESARPIYEALQPIVAENKERLGTTKLDVEEDDSICSASGRNGQVFLYPDRVKITRKGFVSAILYGYRGDKEIMIREITSIGFKKPGFATGYIHFGYPGSQHVGGSSVNTITDSEDAVMFTDEHLHEFEHLRGKLEELRAELNQPQVVAAAPAVSPMDELKKLAELKEMGIVTEDEFEQKKKQLLGI